MKKWIARNSAINIYPTAYQTMSVLGTDGDENGEKPSVLARGEDISWAARFQSASLGMIKLEIMPMLIAVRLLMREPICSIQPPMKARP